jgi:hypothetical protein
MSNNIPRRNRMDLYTPAEKAISDAVQAVEMAGAHPRLTDAVNLLQEAQKAVADFVDGVHAILPTTPPAIEAKGG